MQKSKLKGKMKKKLLASLFYYLRTELKYTIYIWLFDNYFFSI